MTLSPAPREHDQPLLVTCCRKEKASIHQLRIFRGLAHVICLTFIADHTSYCQESYSFDRPDDKTLYPYKNNGNTHLCSLRATAWVPYV